MWTNNMKKLISCMFADSSNGQFRPILTDGTEYKANSFTTFPFGIKSTAAATSIIKDETITVPPQTSGKFGLLVGIGTTEPTEEDYCLANQVVLDTVSFQCTNNGTLYPTVTHTMTNNSGGALVITEIGLYLGIYSSVKPCLLGRKLLETPVTMENGQSYTFQYNIDLTTLQE